MVGFKPAATRRRGRWLMLPHKSVAPFFFESDTVPYITLETNFLSTPKMIKTSPEGQILHTRGLLYSCEYLTNGMICADVIDTIAAGFKTSSGAYYSYADKIALAEELVKNELWEKRQDGCYFIPSYLDHMMSKEQVDDLRAKRQRAGSVGGRKRAMNLNGDQLDLGAVEPPEGEHKKAPAPPRYTYEEIREKWNAINGIVVCKMLEGALLLRIKKLASTKTIEWWDTFFKEVMQSPFMTGKVKAREGKKVFRADLEWATGPINLGKVLSGKYANQSHEGQQRIQRAVM